MRDQQRLQFLSVNTSFNFQTKPSFMHVHLCFETNISRNNSFFQTKPPFMQVQLSLETNSSRNCSRLLKVLW